MTFAVLSLLNLFKMTVSIFSAAFTIFLSVVTDTSIPLGSFFTHTYFSVGFLSSLSAFSRSVFAFVRATLFT
jgi:ABC-type bacteriocin/lantibiotic exporter with double-glycine peptidase domain